MKRYKIIVILIYIIILSLILNTDGCKYSISGFSVHEIMDYFYKNHVNFENLHMPVVAVLDTGVGKIPDIEDNVICFKDFINNKPVCYDDNGHGTNVCGIITGNGKQSKGRYKGLSDKTNLVVLKVADSDGNIDLTSLIGALLWLQDNAQKYDIRIVCMSFGFDKMDSIHMVDYINSLIKKVIEKNVLFVTSAGNRGNIDGLVTFPGSLESVITVGSINYNPKEEKDITKSIISVFSSNKTINEIKKPDNYAPGENLIVPSFDRNGSPIYKCVNGTSFSAAIFCGQLSISWGENYSFSSKGMKNYIKKNSKNGVLM